MIDTKKLVTAMMALAALLLLAACSTGLNEFDTEKRGVVTVEPTPGTYGGTAVATANPGDDNTWIYAACFQDGYRVFAMYEPVDENKQAVITFGPTPNWTGGDAECTVEEGYWRRSKWHKIASTTFMVMDE